VHAPDGRALGRFTSPRRSTRRWSTMHRVMHGVTAVHPVDPARTAYRDVLVVTLKHA
jgi:hypothetical protein